MIYDAILTVDPDDHRLFIADRIADHQRSHPRRIIQTIARIIVGSRDRRILGYRTEGRSEEPSIAVRLRRPLELTPDGRTLVIVLPRPVRSQLAA